MTRNVPNKNNCCFRVCTLEITNVKINRIIVFSRGIRLAINLQSGVLFHNGGGVGGAQLEKN